MGRKHEVTNKNEVLRGEGGPKIVIWDGTAFLLFNNEPPYTFPNPDQTYPPTDLTEINFRNY